MFQLEAEERVKNQHNEQQGVVGAVKMNLLVLQEVPDPAVVLDQKNHPNAHPEALNQQMMLDVQIVEVIPGE